MTPTDIKSQFMLKDGLVFLNHGSFGACPKPVFQAYQDWQRMLESQPVAFLDQERGILDRMALVRRALAKELGADADDLVGVENATAGLNAVARSLDLAPGDEILTTDHEYNALNNTWAFVAQQTGAKIVVVKIDVPLVSEQAFTQAMISAMTERTKVVFLSHVTSPTALVFPIKSVIKEARVRGITSVIDGAHAPGLIDLNLGQLDADFYAGNCHKWMMAPKGAAFLWARKDVQARLNPTVVSHGWVPQNDDPDQQGAFGNSRFIDAFEFQGTRDPSAWLTVPKAIAFKQENDWAVVTQQAQKLALGTARAVSGNTGLPLLGAPEFLAGQMIALPIPECDVAEVKRQLLHRYNIEIPVFRWNDICIARISVQGYNSAEEAQQLVDALSELFPA
ncbi:MAG: aminotransferase class V-fold PLP-dependent enzyme [Marinosulfonomonas sp.]